MADYLAFARVLRHEETWPSAPLGGGAFYGPGVFWRVEGGGVNLWHFGGFCVMGIGDYGAFFFALENGWSVAVHYDICVNGAQAQSLNDMLVGAAVVAD